MAFWIIFSFVSAILSVLLTVDNNKMTDRLHKEVLKNIELETEKLLLEAYMKRLEERNDKRNEQLIAQHKKVEKVEDDYQKMVTTVNNLMKELQKLYAQKDKI